MKKDIAVIEGGFSSEAEISYKSAQTVRNNLDTDMYSIWQVVLTEKKWVVTHNGIEIDINKSDFSFTINNEKIKFDAVFIMIHGTPGEDGKLQGYFDMLNVPYTGCSQFASALTFNKFYCNKALKSMGIDCANGVYLTDKNYTDNDIISKLGLPCFVKPADGGSSFGASKVNTLEELTPAINKAFQHGKSVIIEEYLNGVEVTNGVYRKNGHPFALAITEIATTNDFFDFEAKYNGASEEITPARISDKMTLKIKQISEKVYGLLNLNGVCRIDYMIQDNIPYLIEINTIPGQSSASLIPQQVQYEGMTLGEFYNGLMADVLKS